jgi:hypothetical protein
MNEELEIVASTSSSQHDFDFLIGKWQIHNRKLKSRLSGCSEWTEFEAHAECRKILNGFGNIDAFHTTVENRPFEGMSLRLFKPRTKLWSIYWADSEAVALDVPQVGSFVDGVGRFFARDNYEGKQIIVQFCWDVTDPDKPVWSQAFSADNGQTWEWNWYMTFARERSV